MVHWTHARSECGKYLGRLQEIQLLRNKRARLRQRRVHVNHSLNHGIGNQQQLLQQLANLNQELQAVAARLGNARMRRTYHLTRLRNRIINWNRKYFYLQSTPLKIRSLVDVYAIEEFIAMPFNALPLVFEFAKSATAQDTHMIQQEMRPRFHASQLFGVYDTDNRFWIDQDGFITQMF